MSYLLFIDESGVDRRESPYEVLAGVAIQDRKLWSLIRKLQAAEIECFGKRYTSEGGEAKGKSLLKRKTFRLAAQLPEIPLEERANLGNLTTAIQIADLVAYITAWGLKLPVMREARRAELARMAERVHALRYETRRKERKVSSFKVIGDLRPQERREGRQV